jgi:hypothetical protein
MRTRLFLLALALVTLAAACTVDDSSLDTALFECASDGSCGAGWGCVRATPYAVDFCAPRCTATTCDGICTNDGLCLRGCQIYADGTTSTCPGTDFDCIRTSVESDSGVCYPVTVCASDADCSSGEACLSDEFHIDRLYCVPSAAPGTTCAAGSVSASDFLVGIPPYCFPTCATADRICPPGFGCLHQTTLAADPPAPPPCIPGIPGISCDDDSNCLFGSCLDTGAPGRVCTITCNEASRRYGAAGCDGLSQGNGFDRIFRMECDPAAGGGTDGGLCSVRYALGWPSCTDATGAYPCTSDPPGTSCMPVDTRDGATVDVCTRACTAAEPTVCDPRATGRNYCLTISLAGDGLCMPRVPLGESCYTDAGCSEGTCVGAVGANPGVCT